MAHAGLALKRGHDGVADLVRESTELAFSMIVVGELLFGFRNGDRYQRNLKDLDEFLANDRVTLLGVSRTTADRFGRIAAALRKAGTPIPTNDIWIAAHAFESGAELITFDDHFGAIEGLVHTPLVMHEPGEGPRFSGGAAAAHNQQSSPVPSRSESLWSGLGSSGQLSRTSTTRSKSRSTGPR